MRTHRLISNIIIVILIAFVSEGIVMSGPIPSEIKSVVAFIFIKNKEGKLVPNGTSFLVGVSNPNNIDMFGVYLVTAKHVLWKPGTTDYLDKVFVRLNKKDGGSEIGAIPIIIQGAKRNVFTHGDPSVDIAVIPFLPDKTKFDFKFLPDDMITTKATYRELKIREGSDVFFTGLFTPYPGAERNYPVVRFGRVALVTDEKIEWQGIPMDLYLIEAGAYVGNSGSPVFFYLRGDQESESFVVGSPVIKLAGVMQGTFVDAHEIKVIETKETSISVSSMGIAAVVPGYKLYEILFSEQLKSARGF